MWMEALAIPLCALAGRLHGGGPTFYREWVRKRLPWLDRYLDGDIASPVAFAALCAFFMPWPLALGAGLGWWAGWAPDIGDKVDALRDGNWKPALQRGVFLGSCIALGSWNPAFILAGATFPLWYWLCVRYNKGDWGPAEWAQGAAIGAVLAIC